jgi:hypothetical protein
MYPNEQSYMPNDSVNIEKQKIYLLNTCVFNVNPGNQGSPIFFFPDRETRLKMVNSNSSSIGSSDSTRLGVPQIFGPLWTYCLDFHLRTTEILNEIFEEIWIEWEWNLVNSYISTTFKIKIIWRFSHTNHLFVRKLTNFFFADPWIWETLYRTTQSEIKFDCRLLVLKCDTKIHRNSSNSFEDESCELTPLQHAKFPDERQKPS